jgi:hypothetical protein
LFNRTFPQPREKARVFQFPGISVKRYKAEQEDHDDDDDDAAAAAARRKQKSNTLALTLY